ncbi:ATP-dependent 6-phosphofructokinase [Labeo rohita]|uniref:ATP-dependent 6-phosphofructokinase n=1 Tax=Labeo rohita TaxID=84645 RepID=A0ABQ8MVM8_LABRO|nr:ATP-dependent 6-phosphofructokinase [Labeo rohita]
MVLRVVSYNSRGLHLGQSAGDRAHRIVVDQLLETTDILCLQETFLAKQDLDKLNTVHRDFYGAGESTTDLSTKMVRGRIPGGKCSHGGTPDFTTGFGKGCDGISKDYKDSSHGFLHNEAAEVATEASVQLLEKIWKSTNADQFLSQIHWTQRHCQKSVKKEKFLDNFERAINIISYYNVMTDLKHPFSSKHHFDSGTFNNGKALIINGIKNIIVGIQKKNFDNARETLGKTLHTLQVSYK